MQCRRLTDHGFSGAVPPRPEAEIRESYAERGAEAPSQRTAPRPLLTRVRPPRDGHRATTGTGDRVYGTPCSWSGHSILTRALPHRSGTSSHEIILFSRLSC